ncbi:MAG: hypothetical protein U0894_16370 [Pirellulales bacterium]
MAAREEVGRHRLQTPLYDNNFNYLYDPCYNGHYLGKTSSGFASLMVH